MMGDGTRVQLGETAFFVVADEFQDGSLKAFDVDGHPGVVAKLDAAISAAVELTEFGTDPEYNELSVVYWLVPVASVRNGKIERNCTDTHSLLLAASQAAKDRQR